jgi:hypothetical protein
MTSETQPNDNHKTMTVAVTTPTMTTITTNRNNTNHVNAGEKDHTNVPTRNRRVRRNGAQGRAFGMHFSFVILLFFYQSYLYLVIQ